MNVPAAGSGARRWPPPVLGASGNDPPTRDLPPDGEEAEEEEGPLAELDAVQRSALQDPMRRALWEIVGRTPGLNKRQVSQLAGVTRWKADHHLGRLEDYGLVELVDGERGGEVLCFHPAHVHLWEDELTRALYGQAPMRHVVLYVADKPGAITPEIAEAVDSAPRTVRYHLAKLRDADLVEMHRFGNRVEYHPSPALEAWADEFGERYPRPWTDRG